MMSFAGEDPVAHSRGESHVDLNGATTRTPVHRRSGDGRQHRRRTPHARSADATGGTGVGPVGGFSTPSGDTSHAPRRPIPRAPLSGGKRRSRHAFVMPVLADVPAHGCPSAHEGAKTLSEHASGTIRCLQLVWVLALLAGELFVFYAAVYACQWPVREPAFAVCLAVSRPVTFHRDVCARVSYSRQAVVHDPNEPATAHRSGVPGVPTRIAIIADPQLTDFYSYGQKPGMLLQLTQHYSDTYMRKSYSLMQRMEQPPDVVIFLGDMFDGGACVPSPHQSRVTLTMWDVRRAIAR